MYGLGLRLTLRGGREAFTRLLLTIIAVAIGTTVLLAVFADFNAYQKTSNRPSWEGSNGPVVAGQSLQGQSGLLWNYSENIYKGQFIEQLDVATLGSNAPMLPGISKLPGSGEFYASPALAALLKTVPKDELGDRFPGTQVGTIGEAALSFPTELAVYVGYTPTQLEALPNTILVHEIGTAPQLQGTTNIYKDAFAVGAVAILFPLLILINTATRLSAARREERYAAMRLVGATPHQINVVASVDAIVGSFFGVLAGIVVFLLVRPLIADISLSDVKFFADYVNPTIWSYIGMAIGVPIIAAIGALVSLRHVKVSPLGVSRKASSPKPRAWRIIPILLGVPVFVIATTQVTNHARGTVSNSGGNQLPLIMLGLILIMVGLVLSGSWITMQVTRLLARFASSAPSLLAARRLSDNPKGAFRAISGLILAVFVGSFVAVLVPALNTAQSPTNKNEFSNVLRVPYSQGGMDAQGMPAQQGEALLSKLNSFAGASTIPVYENPAFQQYMKQQISLEQTARSGNGTKQIMVGPNLGQAAPNDSIISCSSLSKLTILGSCPPGAVAASFNSDNILGGDNPLDIYQGLPAVTASDPSTSLDLNNLQYAGFLIKTNTADTLERVRTYLTQYNATVQIDAGGTGASGLTAWQMGSVEPETTNEVAAIRNNDDTNVARVILAMIALTLVTAGCSLAVTVGGSLVERKRPFTLLRVSGAPLSVLYRVIVYEAIVPLIVVSVIAAGVGLGIGIPVIKSLMKNLAPNTKYPAYPSIGYYVAIGVGLIISLGLVVVTLPLLKRMTKPEDARFE
jgi:hypothetical protein